MTDGRTVSSSVEVPIDPATAFEVFTEELSCWWQQGPINFYDSTRAFATRLEPRVGGRLLEVYDDATGEGLEVGRITTWQPGSRLAWTSSLDDVVTEVRFTRTDRGTIVDVTATIPEGGTDAGGTAWVRVTPGWLASWVRRRDRVPHEPRALSRLAVAVRFEDPGAAARWLRDVAGLEPEGQVPAEDEPSDPDHTWIEFRLGDAVVVVLGRDGEAVQPGTTTSPWLFVDDVDAHHAAATALGATVVVEPWSHGTRAYALADPEGNRWTFAQATPLMRASAG